ncbi:hypothetical protein FRC01_011284, partial [Tulasnella sp. 417]
VSASNADSLINHLPTELLTWILQFAVLLGPRTSLQSKTLYDWGGLEYYEELSLIRRVCQKWQAIVETNPSFWIYISTSLPPRLFNKVAECATGSRSLFVGYSIDSLWGGEKLLRAYLSVMLGLSESWTSVHVQWSSPSELLQVLEQHCPRLRKLHVDYCGTVGTFEGLEEGCRTVPSPLEILEVKGSIFPWKWGAITDLRELDVECYDSCPYFSQGFINVLRSSPRLESLGLRFYDIDFQPQLQSSTITLQRLASIKIMDSPQAAGLLDAITCPPSTKITIRDRFRSLTTQNPWVAAAFNHTNFECTERVCVNLYPSSLVRAVIGNIDLDMWCEDEPYQPAEMIQFFTNFFKPFSETNGVQVTTLELHLDLECDAAPLINILESFFPNITSLEVHCVFYNFVSSGLFDALANPIEENGERRWLLPRIEKIAFDFGDGHLAKSATEPGVGSPPPTPLRELHIRNCAMLTSDAEELKHILGDAVKFEGVGFRNPVDEPPTQATN